MVFFAVSLVDIESHRDAQLLFAYLNGADILQQTVAYCICIPII